MGVYGPAIAVVNLLLLVSSTVLVYLGSVLTNFYLLPTIDFVSLNFSAVPNLMLAVGGLGFFGGLMGVVAGAMASRPALVVHALFLSVLFILQLASIFTTSELRADLESHLLDRTGDYNINEVAEQYAQDPYFRHRWDVLQETYACCGFYNLNTGFRDWSRPSASATAVLQQNAVPDSCCVQQTEGCGRDMMTRQDPYLVIYTHGCLSILQSRMDRDVQPLLIAYLGCGVVLAILQLLAIVLSAAYTAVISRRAKRDSERLAAFNQGHKSDPVSSLYHFTDTIPTTAKTGSKRSVYEDEDRMSSSSATKPDSLHRSSLYIEPSNEKGTVI